ncbi:MAG: SusC/RagA family TonB-linked outer membrane protein [Puia sp.]|nr:SusC/RagA family TonB-linked outer membrane protein [Puia sp.]
MKLTAFILLAAFLQVSARGYTQERVTLSQKDAPLSSVLDEIEKQTGYHYFMNADWEKAARKVTVEISNAELKTVLDLCFKDQPFSYQIVGKTIVVKQKERVVAPSTSRLANDVEGGSDTLLFVKGIITDEDGNPLNGATIRVKGKDIGVSTNPKGEFYLRNVTPHSTLEVSFVGFESQTLKINNRTTVALGLRKSENQLDAVQVIPYGTTTQRLSTGNIATVKGEDIAKQPVNNALVALEGQVPGLFVTQNSGVSGGAVTVRVQGQNSIASGNDPFYVIDGVPYSSQLLSTGLDAVLSTGTNYAGSPFSYLNPQDIESIEVLKDADATAIYGSRAANGAILVTTKKGKSGGAKFNINLQQGIGQVAHKEDMMNTKQYLQMRHEAFTNDGLTPDPSKDFDLLLWDTTRYTNWQNALIGNTSHYTNINGSISGGSANVQYLVSGTYHRETSVFPGDLSDQKGSVHFSLTSSSMNQRFHMQFSGNYMFDDNQLPPLDLTAISITTEPDAPSLYSPNGTLNWEQNSSGTSTWTNPLSYEYQKYENKTTNLVSNAILTYTIFKGLDIRSSFGYTNLQTNDFSSTPLIAYPPEFRSTYPRTAAYGQRNMNSWIIEPQISYKKSIGEGKLDFLLGSTIEQNNNNSTYLYGVGYTSDQLLRDVNAAATVYSASGVTNPITEYKYNAVFGRLNYNWQDKYIVDLTIRRDGSSRFGPSSQFHNFTSAGVAWIFSEEEFLNKNDFISFGKLRASYGTTGNDQIPDYSFLSLYNIVGNQGLPYQNTTGLSVAGISNPYLQWEETRKLQGGIDLGFLRNKILLNVTYAVNRSSNQLLNTVLPSIVGFSSIAENFPATVQNTSLELSLITTNIKTKSFGWSSKFNITVPRNKLVDFPNLASSTYTYLVVGQSLNVQHLYHYLGVDPATGQYQFADSKGSPTFSPSYPSDATVLLNPSPKFYGGLQNTLTYKGFQIDFLIQFVKQVGPNRSYWNGGTFPGNFYAGSSNQPTSVLNRWQKSGDVQPVEEYSTIFNFNIFNLQGSDFSYTDASYARLRNLALSWQLPGKWVNAARLQNTRIYVQGQNLLTLTSYKGLDPENLSNAALPPLRILTIGIQMGF